MIITKKRIMGTSCLSCIQSGKKIRFGICNIERFYEKLIEIGFTKDLNVGETVLPAPIGSVSFRNAEGIYVPNKTKEKETLYRTVEWTRKQWAGRGETVEVTDFVDIPYKRYPRVFIEPQSVKISILETPSMGKIILSPEIIFSKNNEKRIVHIVNLLLEIFGECQVFDENIADIKRVKLIKLDWEILPQGEVPWNQLKKYVTPLIQKVKKSTQKVVEERMRFLNTFEPDFKAYGNAGFSGYIIWGYTDKKLFILESYLLNNATYVFETDWDRFSKLTKAQILNNKLQKKRIIHTKETEWKDAIKELFSESIQ